MLDLAEHTVCNLNLRTGIQMTCYENSAEPNSGVLL